MMMNEARFFDKHLELFEKSDFRILDRNSTLHVASVSPIDLFLT